MKELNTIDFNQSTIDYVKIDERVWYSFKNISEILKKPNLYRTENVTIIDDIKYISSVDLQKMLEKDSSAIANELYMRLGLHLPKYVKSISKDILNIQAAFIDFDSVINYEINPYIIQLYFPGLNIAIESDTEANLNKEYELERKKVISNKIGCLFLCFDPCYENFLIGDVIRQLRLITDLHSLHTLHSLQSLDNIDTFDKN